MGIGILLATHMSPSDAPRRARLMQVDGNANVNCIVQYVPLRALPMQANTKGSASNMVGQHYALQRAQPMQANQKVSASNMGGQHYAPQRAPQMQGNARTDATCIAVPPGSALLPAPLMQERTNVFVPCMVDLDYAPLCAPPMQV
jgi:hypothetical protein